MATALVERLCQTYDEDHVDYYEGINISTALFIAGLRAINAGAHTDVQVKTFFNMSVPEQATFDTLWTLISGTGGVAVREGRISRIADILAMYEQRYDYQLPGYDSPDDVQTQLLAISALYA